jgi:hypothetical protein
VNDRIFGRVIDAITTYFAQWLARETARRAAILFTFGTLVVTGLWIGTQLSRLVNDPELSRDIAACGLYMVTGAVFWRLLRKQS